MGKRAIIVWITGAEGTVSLSWEYRAGCLSVEFGGEGLIGKEL